jgi:serine protease Do
MAKGIIQQLREHGHVVRSWMGVSVRDVKPAALGSGEREAGGQVMVTGVVIGSPAATGGLKIGDLITGFDGQRVPSAARLRWYVSTAGVGRSVSLTVRRSGTERTVRVELVEPPDSGTGEEGVEELHGVGSGR